MRKLAIITGSLLVFAFISGCATTAENNQEVSQVSPAQEPVQTKSEQVVEKAAEVGDDDEVCKRTLVTGSHIKKKVCMTKREWDELRETSQELARRVSSSTSPKMSE